MLLWQNISITKMKSLDLYFLRVRVVMICNSIYNWGFDPLDKSWNLNTYEYLKSKFYHRLKLFWHSDDILFKHWLAKVMFSSYSWKIYLINCARFVSYLQISQIWEAYLLVHDETHFPKLRMEDLIILFDRKFLSMI